MVLVCLMIIRWQPNTNPIAVVLLNMTDNERLIITTVWNDMTLRLKLEDDPYSLTQTELNGLKHGWKGPLVTGVDFRIVHPELCSD